MKVHIETRVVDSRQHGMPYIAIIADKDPKYRYKREFIGEKLGEYPDMKAVFDGELEIGTILEEREHASWKNDYKYFFIIDDSGKELELGRAGDAQVQQRVNELLKVKPEERGKMLENMATRDETID